jgi:foldase protein PrsA
MLWRPRVALLPLAVLVAVVLTGCGGSGGSSPKKNVEAQVGPTAITTAEVSHWMNALAGEDFYEVSHRRTMPAGLVSDPPNYSRCLSQLQAASAKVVGSGSKPTGAELSSICRQLYQAVKQQATLFLVTYYWRTHAYNEWGITANTAEAVRGYDGLKTDVRFSQEGGIEHILKARYWSVPDELLLMKLNVLRDKAIKKLESGGAGAGREIEAIDNRWTAKTVCTKGYVVEHCKQYTPSMPIYAYTLPPAVLMEKVAVLTGVHCTNKAAC